VPLALVPEFDPIVSQAESLEAAFHAHADPAVTLKDALAPADPTLALVGDSA